MAVGRWAVAPGASRARLAVAMAAFSMLALLPDADVVAFTLGIPYGAPWGHRGATHSLAFALATSAIVAGCAWRRSRAPLRTGALALVAIGSHGLLDALTDGGRGVALAWPLTDERFFAPMRPLPVAPIGAGLLSARGVYVVVVELLVFSPLLAFALWPRRAFPPVEPPEGLV